MTLNSFPRGGKKPEIKPSNTLFSKRTKLKTKKTKSKPNKQKEELIVDDGPIVSNIAQNLKFSALHEGMTILGRIYKVTDYYAIVSLPGQICGKLQATDISESYTNLLKNIANSEKLSSEFKSLSEIYTEGEYITCYVKELQPDIRKVILSLEPQLINQNLNLSNLCKSSKVVLSVSSVEDHGYVLETGVKNFRAFLSLKDMENIDTKLYPGKQILSVVKEIKSSENIFTVKISVKSKHLDSVEFNITSLDYLVPKVQFSLTIKKILKNGLQVYFGEKNIGYINQLYLFNPLNSFVVGQEIVGVLLYVIPTLKFAYFSLLSLEQETKSLKVGDTIEKAKVLTFESRGILIQLKKGIRGYIPFKRTEVDFEKLSTIFSTDSMHKCRVIAYDSISKLYICSMEKTILNKEYVNTIDLQPGNILKVTIKSINKETGYITVTFGKTSGVVPPDQVSDVGLSQNLKIGQTVEARVLESSKTILLTLKSTLVKSKLPVLSELENAKINEVHDGTVIKIIDQGVLVRFFGNVKGWIPKQHLNPKTALNKWNLLMGQTISVIIKGVNIPENKITLAPYKKKEIQTFKYKIGDVIEGTVIDSSTAGVQLRIKIGDEEGPEAFLPAGHMSPCYEYGKLLAAKSVAGDTLTAIVFSIKPNLILSTTFVSKQIYNVNDLNINDILLCSVKKIHKESLKVLLPINNSIKYGTVPASNVGNIESIYENQLLFGKVTKIDNDSQEINLITQLSKIWDGTSEYEVKMMTSVDVLSCYLNKVSELSKNIFYTSKPISKFSMGQRIRGTVEMVMDHGLLLTLENNVKGIVRTDNCSGQYKKGDEVEGSVLWIDYPHEYVEMTLIRKFINGISTKQNNLAKIPIGEQLRGEIVLITEWFVLVILKGQSKLTLVALPVRRHLNDVVPNLSPYKIGDKVRCYGVLNKDDADIVVPICMVKSAFEAQNNLQKSLKRKTETGNKNNGNSTAKKIKKKESVNRKTEEIKPAIEQKQSSENVNSKKRKKDEDTSSNGETFRKSNIIKDCLQNTGVNKKKTNVSLAISDCGFKWDTSSALNAEDSSSSSEDEINELNFSKKKKKKLTAAERHEFERQKEREIREREEALATSQLPQTVDQFDRLVLSSPNSSLVWMQYMAFHLQATDIEKARAVVRRALQTISFREEEERLNVWQAWLNLESRFGNTETLNDVFQEAIKNSDAQKIYAHVLTVHADAGRQVELEKLIPVMIKKFKQDPECWINCGTALLKIGLKEKSRHTMDRALQSLPTHKHVDLMVRFAQLENKFGDKERSQTLFEKILAMYPKRTDVWSAYIDSLVKSGDVEIARKVLDRAITEVLPPKKMKVLFKKYINFEEKYGTLEKVSHVRELAAKYVEERCNKAD